PVSILQNKIRSARFMTLFGEFRGTNQAGNHSGKGGRRIARVFLPAFLGGYRPVPDEKGRCPENHDARIESSQGDAVAMQTPRQQDGGGNLVELYPAPIRFAIDPAILREPSIRQLNGRKPDQSPQRRSCLAGRQK